MEPVFPPGDSPLDPANKDIDPLAFVLGRVQTYLNWIGEHRASYVATKSTDPELAESEMQNLIHSIEEARIYCDRLTELILAGYTIDPSKRLPHGMKKSISLKSGLS